MEPKRRNQISDENGSRVDIPVKLIPVKLSNSLSVNFWGPVHLNWNIYLLLTSCCQISGDPCLDMS